MPQRCSRTLTFYHLWILTAVFTISNCNSDGCPCGTRFLGNNRDQVKIVGGHLSRQNAWPWTVAIVHVGNGKTEQFCGASVIDNTYVLTAGHCIHEILIRNRSLSDYQVFMGDIRLNGSNIVRYDIASVKLHPFYNPKNLQNDIAIVRLSRTITFSKGIRPICLHQDTDKPLIAQGGLIVVGWGAVRTEGNTVNAQREVGLRLVPPNVCIQRYKRIQIEVTPTNMICASSDTGRDTCAGDSGGPLFLQRRGRNTFEQIGIVSFGRNCAEREFPGVYTRISAFKEFIQANTRDAVKC